MANTCITDMRIYGDGENFNRLVSDLDELFTYTDEEHPGVRFSGNGWVGLMMEKYGVETKGKYLRAWVNYYDSEEAHKGGSFTLCIESAWHPSYDWMQWIEEEYEGVGVSFCAEEPGCEIYETNDPDLFDEKYYVWNGRDGEDMYFTTEEEMNTYLQERGLTDEEDYTVLEMQVVNLNGEVA